MKRPDYLGILFYPSECKKGLFDAPGTCNPNSQEAGTRQKAKQEIDAWLNCN